MNTFLKISLAATFISLFLFLSPYSAGQVATLEPTLSLVQVDGIKIPFQNGFALPTFEKQNRQILNLNGEWKKERFTANHNISLAKRDSAGYAALVTEAALKHTSSYDDGSWPIKFLPAVENQMNTFPDVPEYYEDGVWYRKKFTISAADSGKFVKLMFYSVNYVADVWLNDVYLGHHEGGYTPFAFDVSSALNYNGNNLLAVRVDNPAWGSRNDIVPYTRCDWFNYTGIIHDVYLEFSSPVSVIRTNIVPQDISGDVQVTVVVNNAGANVQNADVQIEVFDADLNTGNINSELASDIIGSPAPVSGTISNTLSIKNDSVRAWRTNLNINNPALWSPKNPNLYVLKVTLRQNGTIVDEYFTQFGIRTIRAQVDKVYLNEKPVFFPGLARHEDHPLYGRSIPADSIYSDLLKVKNLNALMLRTAHYPNHLYTYLIADRLGLAIIEEIPVWWFDTTIAWIIQNSARHIHEQMFREMVFKDYNRPSVILWSTTNECLDVDNRKAFITKVKQDLLFNYADGRLITQSAAADRPGPGDASQAACDVAGWTMYFGIFHGGTYYDGTRYFLGYTNLAYPEKPILDTEYGYWSGELNGTAGQAAQLKVFDSTFAAFTYRASVIRPDGSYRDGGYLMGVTWWCIFDWYSHQHPNGFQSMGLYRMNRDTIKTAAVSLKNGYAPFYNIGGMVTDVAPENDFIETVSWGIEQNYPNPFNPSTKIIYSISKDEFVSIKIYNILGEEITRLVNESKTAGRYEIIFNADKFGLSSGIYFYQIDAGDFSAAKKLIFLK